MKAWNQVSTWVNRSFNGSQISYFPWVIPENENWYQWIIISFFRKWRGSVGLHKWDTYNRSFSLPILKGLNKWEGRMIRRCRGQGQPEWNCIFWMWPDSDTHELTAPTSNWGAIGGWWLPGKGESVLFGDVTSVRSSWSRGWPHTNEYILHILYVSYKKKEKNRRHKFRKDEGFYPEGIKKRIGFKYDQNTYMREILKGPIKIFLYLYQVSKICHQA